MDKDEYGEVINGENTYSGIANFLIGWGENVIIGWTDELGTHYDIFFSLNNTGGVGDFQRGIRTDDLFVGIVAHNFYGFDIESEKHWTYIAEKLRLGENKTAEKVAELINGVIRHLKKIKV